MTPEAYLEQNRDRTIQELLDFLRIPSISTDPTYRPDIDAAAGWVAEQLRQADPFRVEVMPTTAHPILYAEWLGAPCRPTLLVYGHYDVQPPDPLDRWSSPPFEPEIRDGRIYARGASDDKGPMFIPINVAHAFFATEEALPINLKLLFEGEEEIGSPSLSSFIQEHAEMLAADFALSADGAMWRVDLPSITTGSRGPVGMNLELRGPAKDLHPGRHGGAVQNPLHALVELLSTLHRPDGTVAVEGFYHRVRSLTPEERAEIDSLPFDEEGYRREVGAPELFGEPGYGVLERQWVRPTLELNGLGGGYQGTGGKTVIPSTAAAKITCRLVPDQDPEEVLDLVERHLRAHRSPGIELTIDRKPGNSPSYRIRADHPGLATARSVLRNLYGREPVSVLIGGTLPVSEMFARILGIDTVYFSFSTAAEDFHAPNEFFRLERFIDGLRAWAEFWRLVPSLSTPAGTEA